MPDRAHKCQPGCCRTILYACPCFIVKVKQLSNAVTQAQNSSTFTERRAKACPSPERQGRTQEEEALNPCKEPGQHNTLQ